MFKGKFNTHYFFLLLVCGLGCVVQMTVAMQPSINMKGSTDLKTGTLHRKVKSESALRVPVSTIETVPQILLSSVARDPMLSPQGQSECDLRREDRSGYSRDDEDCCDDICYECCCVKDSCICCGTSLLIAGFIWLKSNTGSVQE